MTTVERILSVAADILEKQGVDAVTTRAVCEASGVTAPTLYHHFGDKEGLLRAVAAEGVDRFLAAKLAMTRTDDAAADLRRGWEGWIAFALERPHLFRLMLAATKSDPEPRRKARNLMSEIVERIASEGRLAVEVETAVRTLDAASNGVLALLTHGASADEINSTATLMFDGLMARLLRPARKPRAKPKLSPPSS